MLVSAATPVISCGDLINPLYLKGSSDLLPSS